VENFERDVESVEQFCDRILGYSTRDTHEAFQDALLSNLSESIVGLYSMMHENACLRHGYDAEPSIRLAYVYVILYLHRINYLSQFRFATLLDSSKNGCRLKDGLLQKDKRRFVSKPKSVDTRDILAILKSAGEKKGAELKQKYRNLGEIDGQARDEALCAPFVNAMKTARKYSTRGFKDYADELDKIRLHVDAAYEEFKKAMDAYEGPQNSSVKRPRKSKQADMMLQCARVFSEAIPGIELIQNVEELKASCAYCMSSRTFGFSVAFRRLCLLKAESKPGGSIPSLRTFDEAKKVSSSFLKALEWAEDDHVTEPTAMLK
jgi:hypothetical protein